MTVVEEVRAHVGTGAETQQSRSLRQVVRAALLVDLLVAVLAIGLAVAVRWGFAQLDGTSDLSGTANSLRAAPAMVGLWIVALYLSGAYRGAVFGAGADEFKRVANASLLTAGLVGVFSYLTKYELSRGFFFLAFTIGVLCLLVGRLAVRKTVHRARIKGALKQGVLIAGEVGHVDEIASVLRRAPWLGYQVVGALTPGTDHRTETPFGIPVVGHTDDLSDDLAGVVDQIKPDVIFLGSGAVTSAATMRSLVWDLEQHDVQVVVAPSVTEISAGRVSIRPVAGLPLMHIEAPTWANASRIGKRTFDLVGASFLVFFLSPVIMLSALAIKLSDAGPVLFKQTRIGRNGEEFGCYKFRSMVVDAEAKIAELMAAEGKDALLFKMKDDPRITRPGKWLRRLSIDELPQLFNVIRGHMSLVGPRPQVEREVALYDDAMSRRLHVRPGMTGLWQVSGRNDLSAEEAIRMDLYYVDNWSMLQDLHILVRTVSAVATSRGAY